MRLLILSQYFKPEPFRITEVAESLAGRLDSVEVLTGQPNYPGGRTYKGYKAWHFSKRVEGQILVTRVPVIPRGRRNPLMLFLNYISFVVSATVFGFCSLASKKIDVVFCYAPSPILQAIPGIFLAWCLNARFILNVQDLWPQSLNATGYVKNKAILRIIRVVVGFIYRRCDLILVSSRGFEKDIKSYSVKCEVKYWPNSVSSMFLSAKPESNSSIEELDLPFTCVFAGNVGSAQSPKTILACAEALQEKKELYFLIFGDGSELEWVKQEILNRNLSNVRVFGHYPLEEMPSLLSKADCLMVTLKDDEIFRLTVPNKIQAYLALGRPIIGGISGEGARIINDSGAGFAVPIDDTARLIGSIEYLLNLSEREREKMGSKGKAYYKKHFDHDALINRLVSEIYG